MPGYPSLYIGEREKMGKAIKLHDSTYARVAKYGSFEGRDTFDKILNRILDAFEGKKKKWYRDRLRKPFNFLPETKQTFLVTQS